MNKQVGWLILALIGIIGSMATVAQADLNDIALKDEDSPEAGFTYKKFKRQEVPMTSNDGDVVFSANVKGTGRKECIFRVDSNQDTFDVIACNGDTSPDGRQYRDLSAPAINAGGSAVWAAELFAGFSGLYRNVLGNVSSVIALLGQTAPPRPIVDPADIGVLRDFTFPSIADNHDVVFKSRLSPGFDDAGVDVNQGLFHCFGGNGNCNADTGGTGTLELLVLENDAVLDRPGREFCGFLELDASNVGVAFKATTKTNCADLGESTRTGIFRYTFATELIETVALENEPSSPVAGTGGTLYNDFGLPTMGNDGSVAFNATVDSVGLEIALGALFLCDPNPAVCPANPAEAAVEQGDTDADGNTFTQLSPPFLSNNGMAFQSEARTPPPAKKVQGVYVRLPDGTVETVVLSKENITVDGLASEFKYVSAASISSDGTKVAFSGKFTRLVPVKPKKGEGIFVDE